MPSNYKLRQRVRDCEWFRTSMDLFPLFQLLTPFLRGLLTLGYNVGCGLSLLIKPGDLEGL